MDERFAPGTEFNRHGVQMLKETFALWRNPPVELPAEWVIETVVWAIARAAVSAEESGNG
jgi:hypothetical protein